ncbi:MAG: ABC transporter permease subunit [Propionibacteriaceae bacterium]|jgi:ABC-type glycerol-3-phosphate transport system permease component|nr:ABC transporter permease subunit [Propionibacteriaceae bacterium]
MGSSRIQGDGPRSARAIRPWGKTRRARRQLTFDKVSFMAVFLVVPLALFGTFELWPYLQAFYYSLTSWSGFSQQMQFTGADNFFKLFQDKTFLISLRNSIELVVVVPTLTLAFAFALATVITAGGPSVGAPRGLKGSGLYRVISFFPFAVPALVIGIIWGQVFDPQRGLLNGALRAIGLDSFQNFAWLGQTSTAMPSAMFVIMWGNVGFYTVLFVAAIRGIPAETYEAARIDGAGRFRVAVSVTFPQMLETVQTGYIYFGLAVIDSFVFMQAMFPRASSPGYSTLTITQYVWMMAFTKGQFGYATAMGVVLAAVSFLYAALVFLVFRLLRRRSGWGGRRHRQRGQGVGDHHAVGDAGFAVSTHTVLGVWSVIVIVPFLWTLLSSFKTSKEIMSSPFSLPERWSFDNYVSAWNDAGIGRFFGNTILIVGCSVALVMILGAMCAYVLARYRFPGNRVIYNVMLGALAFPIFLALVPLFSVLKNLGLLGTRPGLILVYVAFALPFTVFFLHSFFRSLPLDVYEAAIVDGAGEWQAFFRVMLPMAAPGMVSVTIFNTLGLWNQYLLPLVLNTDRDLFVLTQAMQDFSQRTGYAVDYGSLFAAVVITVAPVLLVYVIFQRRLEGSVSQGTFR